jgi:nucleoside phosphorylase
MWHWLLRAWIANAAKEQVLSAVQKEITRRLTEAESQESAERQTCDVGVVFADERELVGLLDLLDDAVKVEGKGFCVWKGSLGQRRIVLACGSATQAGAARDAVVRATEAAIRGHRPSCVISAGFAEALAPQLRKGDIVVGISLAATEGGNPAEGFRSPGDVFPAVGAVEKGVHVGRMLCVEGGAISPEKRGELGKRHDALAADRHSRAVAKICAEAGVPCLGVYVVTSELSDQPPRAAKRSGGRKSAMRSFGAFVGALLDEPGSLKRMYQEKESSLIAADALAKFIAGLLREPPADPPGKVEWRGASDEPRTGAIGP